MAKGSGFEREMCKELSLWVTSQMRDDVFWRTPGSGARATTRMKQMRETMDAAGDMMSTAIYSKPYTTLAIWEFKRGYGGGGKKKKRAPSSSVDPLSILDNPLTAKHDALLLKWWRKLSKEKAEHARRYSFLIFKRDRKDKCIVMDDYTFKFIERQNGPLGGKSRFHVFVNNYNIVILRLDDFLKWCHPQRTFGGQRFIKRRKKKRIIKRRKI